MPREEIEFYLDPKSVLASLTQMNKAVEGFEKGAVDANKKLQEATERVGDTLLKVVDRQVAAQQRLVSSIEKQSAAYGKSGVDRLIAERDQYIKRLNGEEEAIRRVTAAYAKMIEVEKGAGSGSGFNTRYAIFGLKDIAEGRTKFAVAELVNELTRMSGSALIVGGVATAVAGIGFAAYEAYKRAKELAEAPAIIRAEFARLNDTAAHTNDELKLTNARLDDAIAKLKGQPTNGLKISLMESATAARHLREEIDGSLASLQKLTESKRPGILDRFVFSQADNKDVSELVKKLRNDLTAAGDNGTDPQQVLRNYRGQALGMISDAQAAAKAGTAPPDALSQLRGMEGIGPGAVNSSRRDFGSIIAELQGVIRDIDLAANDYKQQKDIDDKGKEKLRLDGLAEARRLARERESRVSSFEQSMLRKDEDPSQRIASQLKATQSELSGQGLLNPATDLRLTMAARAGLVLVADEESKKQSEVLLKMGDSAVKDSRKFYDSQTPENERELEQRNRRIAEDIKQQGAKYRSSLQLSDQGQIGIVNASAEHQERLIGINGGKGGGNEVNALAQELAVRQQARQQELEILSIHKDIYDVDKERQKVELENLKDRYSLEEKIAEVKRRQMEEIAGPASGLVRTLLTSPRNFGRQLGSTVRGAAVNSISSSVGGLAARALNPVIFGSDGNGGIAGAFHGATGDAPLKISTDSNTQATDANTQAVLQLTSRMLGGGGASFIGGSSAAIPGVSFSLPSIVPSGSGDMAGGNGIDSFGGFSSGTVAGSIPFSIAPHTGVGPVLAAAMRGGGTAPSLSSLRGGITGLVRGFKGGLGGFTRSSGEGSVPAGAVDDEGNISSGSSGRITGVSGLAGAALFTGGSMLAQAGLFGNARGTGLGIAEAGAGGAAIGFQLGGPLGAAIGAGAGLITGGVEMALGLQSPREKAKKYAKDIYHISISNQTADSIVQVAQSKYGGNVQLAVRSPEVRQMLAVYAAGTGQNGFPISAATPHAGSLAEQGGQLYQQASYQFGKAYAFNSNLPVMGGPTSSLPSPAGPTYLSLNIGSQDTASFMTGSFVTPSFVQDQYSSALGGSNGRLENSAMIQQPGLIIG